MNWFDYIFCIISKTVFKLGKPKGEDTIGYFNNVAGIISVSTFLLLVYSVELFNLVILKRNKPVFHEVIIILTALVFIILIAILYGYKDRYLLVYEKFNNLKNKKVLSEVLSWIYVLSGLISFFIYSSLKN